ncbi:MAG: hypothetical protein HZB26_11325 [Candidatus Hydrogenedentes bacterium]|nr:hypothetical protein [Candidatus Hydrogenedentota bacterium]
MTDDTASESGRDKLAFWLAGAALVAYVACLTGQRENAPFADAWEHHRVIRALTENLWDPGNPTFDSEIPSIRYSPYFIAQALICRTTGIDAYRIQSVVAVLNTILLVLAIRGFLRSFKEGRAAATALIVMVCLYGAAPGWAGSYALSDLPWHQVNPSAFSLPLVIFAWTLFRRFNTRGWRDYSWPLIALLLTEAMLDHAMTGAFGFVFLFVLAAFSVTENRVRLFAAAIGVSLFAALCCLCWPWYPFIEAVRSSPDRDYWFDRETLWNSLFVWPAPAAFCALCAIPRRKREIVRVCLIAAAACFAMGAISFPIRSPLLARMPVPGLLFLHLPVALYIRESGILRLAEWPARIQSLWGAAASETKPIVEIAVAAAMVYFAAPQCIEIIRAPYLARGFVAPLTHKEDKQTNLKQRFDALLAPVGSHDVVLSDRYTSWPIPSSKGRIVAALHYEFFIQNQPARDRDVAAFFADASDADRKAILERYRVKWIVLDSSRLDTRGFASLYDAHAKVSQEGNLFLMDAAKWAESRGLR